VQQGKCRVTWVPATHSLTCLSNHVCNRRIPSGKCSQPPTNPLACQLTTLSGRHTSRPLPRSTFRSCSLTPRAPLPCSIADNYGLTPFLIATKWGRENVAAIVDPMSPLDITPRASPSKQPSQKSREPSTEGALAPSTSLPRSQADACGPARGTPGVVCIGASAGPAAGPPAGGSAGGTTAWMEEILNRVVPESGSTISLPPRAVQDRSSADEELPSEYLCPISAKLMADPVIAADGCTYDNKSLDEWVAGGAQTYPNGTCAIDGNMKLPNTLLRAQINQWKRQHPQLAAKYS
jgi:hypothetical protein